MTTDRLRPAGALLLAVLCAAVLGLSSALSSAVAYSVDQLAIRLRLLADTGWIMSGTGVPDPPSLATLICGAALASAGQRLTGVKRFEGPLLVGGVGFDEADQEFSVDGGQGAAKLSRPVPVMVKAQVAAPDGPLMVAFHAFCLAGFGGLGVEHLKQVSGQARQFAGVELGGVADEELLGVVGHGWWQGLGQVTQDAGDRACLLGMNIAGQRGGGEGLVGGEVTPGEQQGRCLARGETGGVGQPGGGTRAMFVFGGLGGCDLGGQLLGQRGAASRHEDRTAEQVKALAVGGQPAGVVVDDIQQRGDLPQHLAGGLLSGRRLHDPTLDRAPDSSRSPEVLKPLVNLKIT